MSRESEEWDDGSEESDDDQDSLCTILAEEKMRYHDRELQTDPNYRSVKLLFAIPPCKSNESRAVSFLEKEQVGTRRDKKELNGPE